jgi:hypothetical protein
MATAAFDETLRVDSLVGALLLHTGNALWSSSVQSCPDEDASVPAAALRELFLADQLQQVRLLLGLLVGCLLISLMGTMRKVFLFVCLSQVTASTARPRGLHSKHCTRRRRQQQHPDFQQLQQQPLQPACDDLEGDSEFFSDGILGTKQHKGAADLSEHLHVKLRVLSSSSTAGTISGSFCSRNSSLTGNALGRLSIDGHSGAAGNCIAQPSAHPVLHPQQHIAVPAPPAPAQCAHNQQQPHGTEQVHQAQQRAALAVPLSARASLVTGRLEEDVSAQKAAAQALFAEQQQMQAAGSKSCTSFEPGLLQQEQTRLMQQGFQPRLFASMLLGNLLCCLMVVAAKVRQAGISWRQTGSALAAGQICWSRILGIFVAAASWELHACGWWHAQVIAQAHFLLCADTCSKGAGHVHSASLIRLHSAEQVLFHVSACHAWTDYANLWCAAAAAAAAAVRRGPWAGMWVPALCNGPC